jgi:tRNA (guanosine-2'-O-)-methyltransferase
MTPERFARLKHTLARRQPDLTVLTDNVHKSHNVAAILRSCDAVGVHRIHAVAADGAMRGHHMISGGSARWVGIRLHPSMEQAIAALKTEGWRLLAAHPSEDAIDFRHEDYTGKTAILFGSELTGLSSAAVRATERRIAIPMRGLVASLNVSVAAALILYEAERQRTLAGLYGESRLEPEEFARTLFEWAHPEIALRCRRRGKPYPPLSADGSLSTNPLIGSTTEPR